MYCLKCSVSSSLPYFPPPPPVVSIQNMKVFPMACTVNKITFEDGISGKYKTKISCIIYSNELVMPCIHISFILQESKLFSVSNILCFRRDVVAEFTCNVG